MPVVSRASLAIAAAAAGLACTSSGPGADAGDPRLWRHAPALPIPLTNNAVTALEEAGVCTLFTAMGIDQTLSPAGIVNLAFVWHEGSSRWLQVASVPGGVGRIAASAVSLRGSLYVLGGSIVESDGTVLSSGAVLAYDPATAQWSEIAPLPVPVRDQVALAWRDRWIVTVGGRAEDEAVRDVQVFDAETGTWASGTQFPGTPVFGHAGALVGDELVVIDGAQAGAGDFELVNQAWLAALDPERPTTLTWHDLGGHPGPARYRAAAGFAWGQSAWFHGGSDASYDWDGVSHATGEPANALPTTLVFDFGARAFAIHDKAKPVATMDHRNLASCGGRLYTIGGLIDGPAVTADVWVYTY